MKLNKIVLSLVFLTNYSFASDAAVASSSTTIVVAPKPCKNQMRCQNYKFCVERYNIEHGTSIHVPIDEVSDLRLKNEIKLLAPHISFCDENGQLIVPEINSKSGRLCLPLIAKNCADFQVAQWILEAHDNPPGRLKAKGKVAVGTGSLGLVPTFQAMKSKVVRKNIMVCGDCSN